MHRGALEFQGLAAVSFEAEWFANIDNNPRTRGAYRIDLREFHGVRGDRAARAVSYRHPRTYARLAEGLGGAGVQRYNHPAQGSPCGQGRPESISA